MAERRRRPAVIGIGAGLAVLAAAWLMPQDWRETQRERLFDAMLAAAAPLRSPVPVPRIAIIDIDSASLAAIGPWPWSRDRTARLIEAALAAKPTVLALDIVIAGADERSPAALARRLGAIANRADIAALTDSLPDGDVAIAGAVGGGTVVLGWVLDPLGSDAIPKAAILVQGEVGSGPFWSAAGASGPPPRISSAASGAAVASLPGDADGVVRRAPLLVSVGGVLAPGLATEALRLHAEASSYIVAGAPPRLRIGDLAPPLPPDGMLRLTPALAGEAPPRIAAADLIAHRADLAKIEGAIVFLGGSAPELGALRPSLVDPLTPSTLLHAMAARQIAAGVAPLRPPRAAAIELAAAMAAVLVASLLGAKARPLPAAAAASGAALLTAAAAAALALNDILLDPAPPMAAGIASYAASSIAQYSRTKQLEARLRRRFEQHLAPGVVERIMADPGKLRLTGEMRTITALFTDIEGFTATAAACEPRELIAVLDGYFEGIASIVTRHGGMIDKFVGDAVHAFFNMPLDLPDHAARAVAAAVDIESWTEQYRQRETPRRIELGRTRIGVETGEAVVGDVGLSTKLDYTAHGGVVNTAARLEAMNKGLGTAICIGPVAAGFCAARSLRPLGEHEIRGIGRLSLFTTGGQEETA